MKKINKRIEVVSSTHGRLSSMGHASRTAAQAMLATRYEHVRVTIVNDMSDLRALAARKPDLVFLGMKYVPNDLDAVGTDIIWLSQYLEAASIAHTGSDYISHELELNKDLAKQRVLQAGVQTASFQVIPAGTMPSPHDITLAYPIFIKPTNRGGGAGIDSASIAYDFTQLRQKVTTLATDLQADALLETYLPGREFSVGILKDVATDTYLTMPLELIAPADVFGERILSAQVKSADTERHLPVEDTRLNAQLTTLALEVFHALGARDYGRIDIRLDAVGIPHFLEANLLPSLLEGYGNFPKACWLNADLGFEAMLLQIVDLALLRTVPGDEDTLEAAYDPVITLLSPFGSAA